DALADKMRSLDWGDSAQVDGAAQLVRSAAGNGDSTESVRIMLRLARRGAARSLHVSVEGGSRWGPGPRLVDPSVLASVTSASRSGMTPWGEVLADFNEPAADTSTGEGNDTPQPGVVQDPAVVAARIVRSLYEELHVRLGGWRVRDLDGSDPANAEAALLA